MAKTQVQHLARSTMRVTTYGLPRRAEVLHHPVFCWRVLTDVLQPGVPFWGNLRSVVVVLTG